MIEHELSALPPDPYPLRAQAERALVDAATPPAGWRPAGYTARDYLALLRGICAYFRPHQDRRGAIIDPYAGEEKQYATPCYAVAAALVALDGRPPAGVWGAGKRSPDEVPADLALLESAALAQDHALRSLAVDKSTAQGHADFFAPLVVLGYQLLAPFVEQSRAGRWLVELRSIDPEATYRNTFTYKRERGQEPAVHNWNVVAVTGEMLRSAAGAGSDLPWVERYLEYQLGNHADLEWGLYRDPNCPLPYDLFPRHHLGYAAEAVPGHPVLEGWLQRGEWTSALTQTGSGGIPPSGRSSEHLWNDAALVALAETAARRHCRAGRPVAAGLFRRVATLAFRSMLHWQRPSGELNVVKNHFDPAQRWGFEAYSFHSNYGLYPAAMLATAVLFGDCETPERPAPVETGSYVIRYPDTFHKLIATCRGVTLTFDLNADPKYDVTGLNSIRYFWEHPHMGPASGVPAHPRYTLPGAPGAAYGVGLAWTADGARHALAGVHPRGVDLRVERTEPGEVAFALRYATGEAGCEAITSNYTIRPHQYVACTERFEGAPSAAPSFQFPLPLNDGRTRGEGREGQSHLDWDFGPTSCSLVLEGSQLRLSDTAVAHRNGEVTMAEGDVHGQEARWRLVYR